MTMKSTDLQKNLGLKINAKMGAAGTPGRFGAAAGKASDKREQRQQERALGLVPFACKLPAELVKDLQAPGCGPRRRPQRADGGAGLEGARRGEVRRAPAACKRDLPGSPRPGGGNLMAGYSAASPKRSVRDCFQ